MSEALPVRSETSSGGTVSLCILADKGLAALTQGGLLTPVDFYVYKWIRGITARTVDSFCFGIRNSGKGEDSQQREKLWVQCLVLCLVWARSSAPPFLRVLCVRKGGVTPCACV